MASIAGEEKIKHTKNFISQVKNKKVTGLVVVLFSVLLFFMCIYMGTGGHIYESYWSYDFFPKYAYRYEYM